MTDQTIRERIRDVVAWPCDTRQHQQGRQLAWSITALTITLCAIAALTIWSLP